VSGDTFIFQAASAFNNIDNVKDFSTTAGDATTSRIFWWATIRSTDAITDFVTFTNSGSHSKMYVDRDGSGAASTALYRSLLSRTF